MISKKQKGFSLIELLLIIAIVGLLLSIILVNSGTYKDKAQESATLVQINTVLRTIESCGLERRVLFCGGSQGIRESNINCKGDNTIASKPEGGTAICGTISPIGWSESVWPDIEKNGYSYANYAGSQTASGTYTFTVFRDKNQDGTPDSTDALCCSQKGCTKIPETSGAFGSNCYTIAGIRTED